jgi:hypothetical protein
MKAEENVEVPCDPLFQPSLKLIAEQSVLANAEDEIRMFHSSGKPLNRKRERPVIGMT